MLDNIIGMYITLMPPIFAGILNMVWCKSKFFKKLAIPLDGNKNFIDGKRIFGDNKTWKGLIGYIVLNIFTACLWGLICSVSKIEKYNFLYLNHENTLTYNILLGIVLGLAYALFELPNSFMKRRLDIVPGKTTQGFKKIFFIILDQADSVIGCVLAVNFFYRSSLLMNLLYIALGTLTHMLLNMMLYFMKLRKNMF